MKKLIVNIQRVGLFLLFLIFITFNINGQVEKYSRIKIHFDNGKTMQQLAALGIEVDHGQHKLGRFFVSEFSSTEIALLQKNKFHIEVLSKDIVAEFLEKNKNFQNAPNRGDIASGCSPGKIIPQPENFKLGSMGGYFTYQEYLNQLDKMVELYPKLISVKSSIGQSIEGKPIYHVKISDHPTTDDKDPEVLYTAVHHAREPGGLSQLLFYMWYLLENYEKDPLVKSVVDHTQMYFVPCVNPDGYLFNQTTNPDGGGMWRKNRKKNPTNNYGVDLNRNYGYKWGFDDNGSSSTTNNETYRGTSPFSEPETQAIKKLCEEHKFQLALNYHTYGNLLIYPWGYSSQEKTVDDTVFYNFGKLFTKENNYKYGNSIATVSYDVNGGSDDWMYGETNTKNKIYSFTPEVGDFADGFWPPSSKIMRMCRENIMQNLRLALIAGGLSQTTVENTPNFSSKEGYLPFTFQKFGLNNASDYTVTFEPIQNIAFSKTSVNLIDPSLLKPYKDSIAYSITPNTKHGDTILFAIRTTSNKFETVDTITKIYGTSILILSENGNSLENWTSETWNTTTSSFVSSTNSITDSPNGNYSDNTSSTITYSPSVDLTASKYAFLEFNAKWDIELGYDYAQLQVSEDNGISWKAICGAYSHGAKVIEIYDQPVYDGTQKEWIKETINLKDFIGKKIKVRFELKSDEYTNYDGFYFDDFKVNAFNDCNYSIEVAACKSYTWNNTTYTKSGIYTYKPTNGGICDSTWYLNLTILPKTVITKSVKEDTLIAAAKTGKFTWVECTTNNIQYTTTDTCYFVPKASGNYKLIHTSNECTDTSNCLEFTVETANYNLQLTDYKISIHPNPFKEEVTIAYSIPKGNHVEIELVNALGIKISTLFSGKTAQNSHQLTIAKSNFELSPGVYFIRFNVNDQHILRKLLLIE